MTDRPTRRARAALAAVLSLAPVAALAVTPTGEGPIVDRQSPASVSPISSRDIDNLPTSRPIMEFLRTTPAGAALDRAGINIYGHVEMGYTYNFDTPDTNQNAFRLFDNRDNRGIFNQID